MTLADSAKSTPDPLEREIAAEVWKWLSLPDVERIEIVALQSDLALSIEFYLCGAFHCPNLTPSRWWWCDGVSELSVCALSPTAFQIVGAAYWATTGHQASPFYLAPFELELYFAARNELDAERVVVRFGTTDTWGNIQQFKHNADAARVVRNRPTNDKDWAFAIELS